LDDNTQIENEQPPIDAEVNYKPLVLRHILIYYGVLIVIGISLAGISAKSGGGETSLFLFLAWFLGFPIWQIIHAFLSKAEGLARKSEMLKKAVAIEALIIVLFLMYFTLL
jgi:hypothetical protein